MGGELKSTVCLVRDGQATLSQHLGDLEDARTADEYERAIALYLDILQISPEVLAVDGHPDYRPTRIGRDWAARDGLALEEVQHHHAHAASVLAENGWEPDAGKVLGLSMDGLGYGADGTIWGGELLLADYLGFRRVGHLKPVPMPGGVKAVLEPWRNTWAHLHSHFGWGRVRERWPDLELVAWLSERPLEVLSAMVARGLNSPPASSAGRLFDAVAAAVGVERGAVSYEGQAAIELEALARQAPDTGGGYPFGIETPGTGPAVLDPAPMWEALLDDLGAATDAARVAARFHRGLADAVVAMAAHLAGEEGVDTVTLSGGVLQNRSLFEGMAEGLRRRGLRVLSHRQVPANDGGLSLGQAAVATARRLDR
jgi:hydrogenase maturation protein HypF